ncbi:helix-turn-helix transcriptional regulator [Streptomyces sp. ZSW22]|uniref:helix-turn-helix domain-containing protein n=1 Tax=Streptomyces sp. ZSW22 TaxID=3055050 RepID=UPI0025B0DF2F|nr:helix-turn-helix transcriptional regulator [Streptomyces sp. ZSW22]MDN3249736.1 helix-turn-helix transcriptional regulator [Streptomyces sp. ZSW22]
MPRRPTPLDPEDGPKARFAIALRQLRDRAGFDAKTIDQIAAESDIPRATLYAAMRGQRIPTVPVLRALVRAWHGDAGEWLTRRTETEQELERLRLEGKSEPWHPALSLQQAMVGLGTFVQQVGENAAKASREASPEPDPGSVSPTADLSFPELLALPEDVLVSTLINANGADALDFWITLRRRAGYPRLRDIADGANVAFHVVADVTKGFDRTPTRVKAVLRYLRERQGQLDDA